MPLFKKSSSSKIPPIDSNPQSGSFSGGAGFNRQPQSQSQMGMGGPGAPAGRNAYQQQPAGGYGYGQQPQQSGGYGQQQQRGGGGGGGYGYGNQQGGGYQQQDRFPNAKPPSNKLGSEYDQLYGSGNNQSRPQQGQQQQYRGRGGGVNDDDLEAEYGQSRNHYNNNNHDDYGGGEQQQQETTEEEDEVEAIKQQMRFTKQESLSSTRNALRLAREAEETASNSLLKLGDQSDKIANTERHLDLAKSHSSRADDNAREITALNRSIFRPNFQMNKQAKRDAEEARMLNRHIEERDERERVRTEALQAQNRVDQTMGGPGSGKFGSGRFGADRFGGGKPGGGGGEDGKNNRMKQRSRFQFEATGSDDELEDELDGNLDEISQLSGRLNQLGRAMGTEIDDQNERIKRLQEKTTRLDERVYGSTQKLDRIK